MHGSIPKRTPTLDPHLIQIILLSSSKRTLQKKENINESVISIHMTLFCDTRSKLGDPMSAEAKTWLEEMKSHGGSTDVQGQSKHVCW